MQLNAAECREAVDVLSFAEQLLVVCLCLRLPSPTGMTFGEFAEHTLSGYYNHAPAGSGSSNRSSEDDTGHVPGTPDYPPAAGKDVAPAAVHLAAAAAGRQFAQMMITHE